MTFDPCIKALEAFRSSEAKSVCNDQQAQNQNSFIFQNKVYVTYLQTFCELQELIIHW